MRARVRDTLPQDGRLGMARRISRQVFESLAQGDYALDDYLAIEDTQERDRAIAGTVERMLASLPQESRYNQLIGPFYDTPGLERWSGKTRQAIEKWRRARKVLSITTSTGRILYPSFQFGPKAELLPGLPGVIQTLTEQAPNPLTQARWLNTPTTRFNGHTAAELLRDGHIESVLAAARADAARLAG
ncbi:MAG TPA: hypothetical protein VFQ96_04190 [Microbacteriaceae bacterium]|nr:hypothetical protein [Microbacteriaceae bacterium]